ncbi:antitoxin [Cupriavidus basilensis]
MFRIVRSGNNQIIEIPPELSLPSDKATIRKEGNCLIVEPTPAVLLRELLAQWSPLEEESPESDC